jgi:hypothetical protein
MPRKRRGPNTQVSCAKTVLSVMLVGLAVIAFSYLPNHDSVMATKAAITFAPNAAASSTT